MKLIAAITLATFVAGCEQAYAESSYYGTYEDDAVVTLAAAHGPLTGENGMTLYTFDNDSDGKSVCNGDCAVNWPPYLAAEGATAPGDGFAAIKRDDGTMQWAKDGAPLYFWAADQAPGDTTGDGVGGVWHIAR